MKRIEDTKNLYDAAIRTINDHLYKLEQNTTMHEITEEIYKVKEHFTSLELHLSH